MVKLKRRDGFEGEKLIALPEAVWKKAIKANSILSQLYVTHIGYFPKATYHYRERRNGCPDNILIYCVRGKGWYAIKGKRFEVGVNQFFILPATLEHTQYGAHETDPWTIYWVHFSGNNMKLFNQSFKIGPADGPQTIRYNETGLQLWNTMYHNLEMGYSMENLVQTNLCLYHFISTFLFPDQLNDEKKQEDKDMIQQSILFMRANAGSKFTVEELAKKYNYSASHYTHLFRKGTGMSPLDYFIHLKLQRACLLLQTSGIKIKNLAEELGYDDPYYFSRLFKKYMSVSPEQYRLGQRR